MVSHELRTPLSAVLACAHLLDRGQLDQAQTMHAIHVIERNAKAAARIIDDLLDVSRITGGNIDPCPKAVARDELVAKIASLAPFGRRMRSDPAVRAVESNTTPGSASDSMSSTRVAITPVRDIAMLRSVAIA